MERIQEIKTDEGGNVLRIVTQNYEFVFPKKKRPDKGIRLQKGDVFQFNCQGQGGTPLYPRVTIQKPGLEQPIYSEVAAMGCIQPTIQ